MKASRRAFLFGLLIFGFLAGIGAAAGEDKPPVKYPAGTQFSLTGLALYRTWEIGNGEVIVDGTVPCDSTLEFLEDNNFKYTFVEHRPNPDGSTSDNGPYVCYGKMSASGELRFTFPTPLAYLPDGTPLYITDVIRAHACATIWGPGINENTLEFKGRFDGEHFNATARFMATVASPCPSNNMWDPAEHPGPVHWIFGYDLVVK